MDIPHLTPLEIEQYAEQEVPATRRAAVDAHVAACDSCRAQATRHTRLTASLRALTRQAAPADLAARISTHVEQYLTQEQIRRTRVPLIASAMVFSFLLVLWFALEMIVAFQENGVLDFFTLYTNDPGLVSLYSWDAILALCETLPFSEITLTGFALITALVLAQQLVDTLRPRTPRPEGF